MPDSPRWVLDGTNDVVSVWCGAYSQAFYVTAEPHRCPYCGSEDAHRATPWRSGRHD